MTATKHRQWHEWKQKTQEDLQNRNKSLFSQRILHFIKGFTIWQKIRTKKNRQPHLQM